MKPVELAKSEVDTKPYLVWNAFVELLAMSDYEDLSPEQRVAHLVFWYESEVQNGGHLQYFENLGTKRLDETIAALGVLGATTQQTILREAGELWRSRERKRIKTVEEYCAVALEGEFESLDSRFYKCSPSLQECLEDYLRRNQEKFVIIK